VLLFNFALASLDAFECSCTSEEKLVLLIAKVVHVALILINDLFVELDQLFDIFADCLSEDQFASKTVTLIELPSESSKLTHDLNEITLSLGILELHFISILILLHKLLLEANVLFKSVRQLDFVFLDNTASDLLMYCLPVRTDVPIDELHAGAGGERLSWRCLSRTYPKAIFVIQHVEELPVHLVRTHADATVEICHLHGAIF